jgi:type I restriction enzyme S subunit
MSCAGELGIVAITAKEIVVNQQLHAFIPTERIDASFLLNALDYLKEMIENRGTKTAVPYLNKNACNSIPIPLPPLPEQRVIATALSDVDALIAGLERLIAKKHDIKQAAMQQLLTGQTRLPGFSGEWDLSRLGEMADSSLRWSFTGGPFGSNLKSSDYTDDGGADHSASEHRGRNLP